MRYFIISYIAKANGITTWGNTNYRTDGAYVNAKQYRDEMGKHGVTALTIVNILEVSEEDFNEFERYGK